MALKGTFFSNIFAVGLMFFLTNVGWMIFRQTDFGRLKMYFSLNPFLATEDQWVATVTLLSICALVALPMILVQLLEKRWRALREFEWFLPIESTIVTCLLITAVVFSQDAVNDFIYFQF
jgi:hypothetical protein